MGLLCSDLVTGWVPVGGSIFPDGSSGSAVDLSDDGRRLAVGSPSQDNGRGCISVYELDWSGDNWHLLVEIPGMPGEGLGDALAISPDGLLVAARRHHVIPNAIQVFQVIESGPATFLYDFVGPLVHCPVDGNGTSVQLAQAHLGPVSQYLLLTSCEDFDSQRGMVQAYILDRGTFLGANDVAQWTPYLPALTAQQGDRFGHATAIVHAPHLALPSGSSLRVAVAAPYHDWERGSVQVFLPQESGWSQLGQSIVGLEVGEKMGFALDMSSTERSYLAVGSPGAHLGSESISRGSVQVLHWRTMPSGEAPSWYTVGVLKTPGDFVGHSVAMSRDGHRVATGSIHYDSNRGYVALYEMDDFETFRGIGPSVLGYERVHGFGASFAMNAHGSLIAVTGHLSEGSATASVWIDSSPFCQVQLFANNFVTESVWDSYLRREVCRDGTTCINDTESCESTFVFLDGQWASCAWEDRSLPQVLAIDVTPSVTHHESDATGIDGMASCAPSVNAAITTPVPSHKPTSTTEPVTFPNEHLTVPERYNASETESSSQSPTGEIGFGEPFVVVCRCDEQGFCINQSLPQDVKMRLCLRVSSRVHKPISVLRMDLSQPDYLVVMIDDYVPVADKQLVQTCKGSLCTITMSAPAVFYDDARPPYMTISGRIALIRTNRLQLPGSEGIVDTTVTFDIDIELADAGSPSEGIDRDKNTPVLKGRAESTKDKPNAKTVVAIGALLGSLALLGMFAFETYVSRRN